MSYEVELIECGAARVPVNQGSLEASVCIAPCLFDASETQTVQRLNVICDASSAPWIGLYMTGVSSIPPKLTTIPDQLNRLQERQFGLMPQSDDQWFLAAWQRLPPEIASVVRAPEWRATLFIRREELADLGGFQTCSAPFWELSIRAARRGWSARILDGFASQPLEADSSPHEYSQLAPDPPGEELHWLRDVLKSEPLQHTAPKNHATPESVALKAALFQIHDFLDESHQLSQSIEGEGKHLDGDYWHAIMHRREPDDSNAKYWFRRAGRHPVFETLAHAAEKVFNECNSPEAGSWQETVCPSGTWDPFGFVDMCSYCRRSSDKPLESAAREIQFIEMLMLLEQTYLDAKAG